VLIAIDMLQSVVGSWPIKVGTFYSISSASIQKTSYRVALLPLNKTLF